MSEGLALNRDGDGEGDGRLRRNNRGNRRHTKQSSLSVRDSSGSDTYSRDQEQNRQKRR